MENFALAAFPIFAQALKFFLSLTVPLLAALFIGAVVGGLLRAFTRLNDDIVSFLGRFAGLVLGLYLLAQHTISQGVAFATRLWGGSDFYF